MPFGRLVYRLVSFPRDMRADVTGLHQVKSIMLLPILLAGIFLLPATAEETPPRLVFTPWAKRFVVHPEANAKRTCTTAKDGRTEAGISVVSAALVEREGDKAIFRVTLPLGMSMQPGTRLIVDNGTPMTAPYVGCSGIGCTAEYEAAGPLIARLKRGQGLVVQGINGAGQPISLVVPLSEFAKAHETAVPLQHEAQSRPEPETQITGKEPLTFSAWTKFCLKGQEASAKQVCFTGKEGRIESGQAVVAAVLIEPESEPKKVLRVTLPLGASIQPGTRVFVDNGQAMTGPYVICFNNGCMADYAASAELISKLRNGERLFIQGVNAAGEAISLAVPLSDFVRAHDGPPTDPNVFEAQQKKLQEELQRRAEEARKKLGKTQPAAQSPPPKSSAVAAVTAPASIDPGRRVALVIGNSAYRSVPMLPNPRLDADAIAGALQRIGFQSVKLEHDLSREKLIDALRAFAREAETADWAVVYFAGHGIEVSGTNYVVPVDAKLEIDRDVDYEAVPLNQIINAAEGARKLRIVLLDACRDNPFARQMRRAVATRSIGRGLARVEPEGGTILAYAAKHGEIALDGADGTNSPFVRALLKHLPVPGLEINKLFRLVRDDVMTSTGRKQEPFVYGSLPAEDFFFVRQ